MIPLCSPTQAQLPTALALGSFDGLHAGHRSVINAITKEASAVPSVVSFWPHPREILYNETRLRLDLPSEKKCLLEPLGVKQLILIPFNKDLASLSAEEFIKEVLVNSLSAQHIAVGQNFRFGNNRQGDSNQLKEIASSLGIKVSIIPILEDSNGRISSSRIRNALSCGDLNIAKKILGRRYNFKGVVVNGKGLGKKIGWPTANLQIDGRKFLPQLGVYAAWTSISKENTRHPAIMNLGPQPTVDPLSPSVAEVHILDKDIDLLGKELVVEPIERLRSQTRFGSIDLLCQQISLDAVKARSILKEDSF